MIQILIPDLQAFQGFGYFFVLGDVRSSVSSQSRWCLDRSKSKRKGETEKGPKWKST